MHVLWLCCAAALPFVPLPSPTPVPAAASHSPPSPPATPSSRARQHGSEGEGLDLASIRDTLIRLEESIIFALIERAQFRLNSGCYTLLPDDLSQDGEGPPPPRSILSEFIRGTERLHAQYRRYTSPVEHPFSDPTTLPQPILPPLDYPPTIRPNRVNHNERIMRFYLLERVNSSGE